MAVIWFALMALSMVAAYRARTVNRFVIWLGFAALFAAQSQSPSLLWWFGS